MGIAEPSKRLEAMPPYMFAELERRIAAKREAGIDVISLGIGDPDEPTYAHIVAAMQEAVADPGTQKYPSNRGRPEFRQAFAEFYGERFGVEIDPGSEVIPAIGAKECIYNLCFAFLNPGDVALAADPGYPVYTGGPLIAGAESVLMPLVPELGFVPDLDAIPAEARESARLMYLNYPNNPTGAAVAAVLRGLDSPVTVHLDGGDLEVEVGEDLLVDLTGWAVPVYAGELSPEFLEALREA